MQEKKSVNRYFKQEKTSLINSLFFFESLNLVEQFGFFSILFLKIKYMTFIIILKKLSILEIGFIFLMQFFMICKEIINKSCYRTTCIKVELLLYIVITTITCLHLLETVCLTVFNCQCLMHWTLIYCIKLFFEVFHSLLKFESLSFNFRLIIYFVQLVVQKHPYYFH